MHGRVDVCVLFLCYPFILAVPPSEINTCNNRWTGINGSTPVYPGFYGPWKRVYITMVQCGLTFQAAVAGYAYSSTAVSLYTLPCAAGKFSPARGGVCRACPAGTFSGPIAAACTNCTAGYTCTDPAQQPVPCDPGQYSDVAATNCSLCAGVGCGGC